MEFAKPRQIRSLMTLTGGVRAAEELVTHAVEHFKFVGSWLRHPFRTGAMLPSGEALARLLVSEIRRDSGPVIELGGGTGAITQAILKVGIPPRDLHVFETSPDLGRHLKRRFPEVAVYVADAATLHLYCDNLKGGAAAVVSSIPMLSIPNRSCYRILARAFDSLAADGRFYQFTYGRRCPIPEDILDHLGLRAEVMGHTWWNWPPARVYRIERR